MDKAKKVTLCMLLLISLFAFIGCGKKKADPNKPVTEVKAEADKMDVTQLKEMVASYKETFKAKEAEVNKLMVELKKVPLAKMVGEEAKDLKADIDSLNKAIAALNERMKIYTDKLAEKSAALKTN